MYSTICKCSFDPTQLNIDTGSTPFYPSRVLDFKVSLRCDALVINACILSVIKD